MTKYEIQCFRAIRYLSYWARIFVWTICALLIFTIYIITGISLWWLIPIGLIATFALDMFHEKKADDFRLKLEWEQEQKASRQAE